MANIKSAEKQNRKMIKHRARNRAAMASLPTTAKRSPMHISTLVW